MNTEQAKQFINDLWDAEIVPQLYEYIKIPNKSPIFDKNWQANGYMEQAVSLMTDWAQTKLASIAGATLDVIRLENRTPLIFIDIPATDNQASGDCVLLYGHLDKQPEMTGWRADLGPWQPVIEGDKLYGRGGADDGYAIFGSIAAILALQQQNIPHARCVIIIEACEESGSYDLPFYIDHLADRIGQPSLVVCLDSGCANYDQLWLTTSLRGMVAGDLQVQVLTEGVHSGDASGVVPDSFRIARDILSRLEDPVTGNIIPNDFYADIPAERIEQAKTAAAILRDDVYAKFPFVDGMQASSSELSELILNRTWRPQLTVTGAGGLPALENAGNVLRPSTTLKLSLRLPAMVDCDKAGRALKQLLEENPPYNCKVSFNLEQGATGWNAPALSDWLKDAVSAASKSAFANDVAYMGEGGSIPFMGMLGEKFPQAQFLITGVLGPHSNAHGPNEFLHIPTGKRVTHVVAQVIAQHLQHS